MTKAIYAGSFDPFTLGHLDILNRASNIFDEVIIAIGTNTSKKALFSADEKYEMIIDIIKYHSNDNVRVIQFTEGLIVDLAEKEGANVMIRGLRSVKDMEYEMDIASMNKTQNNKIETVFLTASEKYRFVSSTLIKEVAQFDGDLTKLVPEKVISEINKKYSKK